MQMDVSKLEHFYIPTHFNFNMMESIANNNNFYVWHDNTNKIFNP